VGLELIKEADMVLDACGRPSPPPGFKFVDLPRIINFSTFVPSLGEGGAAGAATQFRVTNNAKTLFICRGVGISGGLAFRIKWPNGRFFNQNLFDPGSANADVAPVGRAGTMIALNAEQPIQKGARIGVEHNAGTLDLEFWGCLRYLIKEVNDGAEPPGVYCIMGYPSMARTQKSASWKLQLIDDPITALEAIPRYMCGPNQNIMAPEVLLGVGPSPGETPVGCTDDSFTFFSTPTTFPVDLNSYGNVVIVPGHDDVVLKRWRPVTTWDADTSGIPVVNMRLPNGYSVTGGDFMPMVYDWMPFFPTLRVAAGTRIILDFAATQGTGDNITTQIEFEAVKRTGCQR
jgi:hypothetical protein